VHAQEWTRYGGTTNAPGAFERPRPWSWAAAWPRSAATSRSCSTTPPSTPEEVAVIYVQQRWTGWWAECDECEWKAGPCDTQVEAQAQADQHDIAMGEVRPDQL
jgi:hypothetical protein